MLTEEGVITPPPVWAGDVVAVEALRTDVVLDDPPPISINKAYTVVRGRTMLTTAGKKYKDAVRRQVARASFQWKAGVEGILSAGGYVEIHILVYLPKLFNASWKPGSMTKPRPNKKTGITPKPKRRNPYQSVDGGNFLKLLEDGVVNGCGIDDAAHLDIHIYKRQDPKRPRVEVIHRVMIPA